MKGIAVTLNSYDFVNFTGAEGTTLIIRSSESPGIAQRINPFDDLYYFHSFKRIGGDG